MITTNEDMAYLLCYLLGRNATLSFLSAQGFHLDNEQLGKIKFMHLNYYIL